MIYQQDLKMQVPVILISRYPLSLLIAGQAPVLSSKKLICFPNLLPFTHILMGWSTKENTEHPRW